MLRWSILDYAICGFAIRDFGGVRIHRSHFEASTGLSTDNIMNGSGLVTDTFDDVSRLNFIMTSF
jgi:hypothetical protein